VRDAAGVIGGSGNGVRKQQKQNYCKRKGRYGRKSELTTKDTKVHKGEMLNTYGSSWLSP